MTQVGEGQSQHVTGGVVEGGDEGVVLARTRVPQTVTLEVIWQVGDEEVRQAEAVETQLGTWETRGG